MKKSFVKKNIEYFNKIVEKCAGISTIIGFVEEEDKKLYNSAGVICNAKMVGVYRKKHLPNYDVFDEKRYFTPYDKTEIFELNGLKIGVNICEDIWIFDDNVVKKQKEMGADLIINLSASPFYSGKVRLRQETIQRQAKENKIPIIYVNLIGGQDDLIFDGRSCVFNEKGEIISCAKSFDEDFLIVPDLKNAKKIKLEDNEIEDLYNALVLGLKDYVQKNGFSKVILGLSGGIDSALTAALAVKALGKENVAGISMPSRFSSEGSIKDSEELARNLGINFEIISIKEAYESYLNTLSKQFNGTKFNIAEENIQARIRGNILMALSNKFGHLVLTTGNKSEVSVGYATLYGDMAGGLGVISNIFKIKVYELSNYINKKEGKEIIPKNTILKAPSAELRENQKDSDSLPEYNILDPILKELIEEDKGKEEIISMGFDAETVKKVINLVDKSEYKRKQAALGLKITPRAFGSGRRMPITNKWKEV